MDTVPPAAPSLASPANGSSTTDTTPTLKWNAASSASSYEWQIANNASFSPVYASATATSTTYTFPSPIPNDLYYWRVRAKDAAGNISDWSTAWNVYIVPIPTTLTVSRVTGIWGSTVNLSATLKTTNSGIPLSGRTIFFSLNGANLGTATTDANGVAVKSAGLKLINPGDYPTGIEALFNGDAYYSLRIGRAVLWVLRVPTTLTVTPVSGPHEGTANLSATLTVMGDGTPVKGKTISFVLNGATVGSAYTDANGVATLIGVSLTGNNVGTYPSGVGAIFAGDGFYDSSSGSAQLTINIIVGTIHNSLAPTVTSFTPTSGSQGVAVTITGTNFTGATAVKFGATDASSFTVDSPAQITAVVGSGASGRITVTTAEGTATSADNFNPSKPPGGQSNWWLIGAALGGVIIIGAVAWWLLASRRKRTA